MMERIIRYLVVIIVAGLTAAVMQTAKTQTAVLSPEDLQTAYSFCTKRYIERDRQRKLAAKWQQGFESCDGIVSKYESQQSTWQDVLQHKSKIDAIAAMK